MWDSPEWLSAIGNASVYIALGAALVAAIAGAAGTIASNRASSILGQRSDERIAKAHARSAEADARAADASKSAAEANERVGDAEARAADARLETEKLKLQVERERAERLRLEEKVKPRTISEHQKAVIKQHLTNAPRNKVFVVTDWMNGESKQFGACIASLLAACGFPVSDMPQSDDKPLSFTKLGAFWVIKNGAKQPLHLRPLHDAFLAAGFQFEVFEEAYVPDERTVLIGVSTR